MEGRPGASDLWGKFRDESRGGPTWHPLVDHCTDVACVLEALLRQPTIRRRLARAGGLDDLDEIQIARLCFLAFLHDLGKCNWGFQRKILPGVTQRAGHVSEVGALLLDERLSAAFEAILPAADVADWMHDRYPLPLFAAVISHHRRQLQVTDGNMAIPCDWSFRRLWEPAHGRRPLDDIHSVIAAARSTFASSFETGGARIPSVAPFQHAFCGLVMLADWIGSDERGFPFREPDDPSREARARALAAEALSRIGLAVERGRAAVRDAAVDDAAANGFPLNTVQRAVADLPFNPPPRLVVLEAETGSGKTEAALLHFKRLFEAGLVDGFYFALPTRSSASQIQNRVVAWTKRLFPPAGRPRVVLAVPGYVQVDDQHGDVLPRFEVLWEDDPDEVERQRRWAAEHPKRYMAGQIVVGTIDQALLGDLQVPYAHLRSSALLRHLLIVDEVHASDAYMTAVLRALLEAHLTAGGFALLMSATLGTVARETLQGLDSDQRASLADALQFPYPALACNRNVPVTIVAAGSVKRVAIDCRPHLDQPQEVVSEAVRAADAGAKVLIVRNTVADAVALFEAIRDRLIKARRLDLLLAVEGVPTLHHGRFALEDRLLLDRAVEAGLGRRAARPRGLVVIGTQTLEQSLDIDADLLITDLCPMDVLLQRIGRLHRHPDSRRPNGLVGPRCIALVPAEQDLTPFIDRKTHGLGSVYADVRIIQATRDLLEHHPAIEIPTVSRALVERATHPEALERIVRNGGSAWQRHADSVLGDDYAKRGIAALHVIDRSRPFGSFTFASIDQRVTTRLGADDRLLTLVAPGETPPGGAFGRPVTTLKIPGHLVKGVPEDATARNLTTNLAGFVFALGDRSFIYDATGLRRSSD